MVSIKYIIILISMIGLLHGCLEEESEMVLMVTPEDKTVFDTASVIYSDDQLLDIVCFSGTPEELNELYPFEFVRYDEEADEYLVAYLGDKKIAIQAFACTEDARLYGGGIYTAANCVDDFLVLSTENTLADVKELDPDGYFEFLYTGLVNYPKVSTHFTVEGYIVFISYDDEYKITGIEKRMF